MIVLTIAGILMAIGIPTYINVIASNNVSSEINALWSDLQHARSQAIKQGLQVTVCAAGTSGSAPYTCSGSATTWLNGWVTYTGAYSTAAGYVTSAMLLRVQQPLLSTYSITSTNTTSPSVALPDVSFNSFGFTTTRGSIIVHPPTGSTVSPKSVCISAVGNVQVILGADTTATPLCP